MDEVIDPVELRKACGHHVRRLRIARGWTQGELAERVEITRVTLNRIERGHQAPGLEVAFALADVFGVPIETFRQIPALAS
jgi:putative transcriptional regulator